MNENKQRNKFVEDVAEVIAHSIVGVIGMTFEAMSKVMDANIERMRQERIAKLNVEIDENVLKLTKLHWYNFIQRLVICDRIAGCKYEIQQLEDRCKEK